MPLINRNDLKYDYAWTTEPASKPRSSPKTTEKTDSQIFRGEEGDEVLSFINDYTRREKISDKKEALKIEKLLRDEMKNKDMTRREVRLWLNEHRRK